MAQSTILVTGGAGYIGSHCVKQLMAAGHTVVVVDDLSNGHRELVLTPHFVQASTTNRQRMLQVMTDYEVAAVMHFAASAYVGESVSDPEKYYYNNVYGTHQLLSAMRQAGVRPFVFSSTCATYGTPAQVPITETTPQAPINPYGHSKRMVEQLLADYDQTYGICSVSLRYFNAAGACPQGKTGEWHEPETHLIPLVLQGAAGQRNTVKLFGTDYDTPDGTCIRDYIHVDDIAAAHLLALDYLRQGGATEVFNLGTETGHSVRQVIAACERVTGRPVAVEESPRRPGDPPRLLADASKIKRVLGWQPAYTNLEPIVQTAWDWETRHKPTLLQTTATS